MPPRCRILLAEDNDGLREILVEGLTEQGFDVVAAEDGGQAWDALSEGEPFDVLLLDEEMPGLTGRQILERLRGTGSAVPAFIISGNLHIDADEKDRLGVEVLRKPVKIGALAALLWTACGVPAAGAVPGGEP
jgi:CheY-like chemotaxis protein